MPALSFSAVEILPSLLDRSKTQTIRPSSPRLKVGDTTTLYWKQRGKYKIFCSKCGHGGQVSDKTQMVSTIVGMMCQHCGYYNNFFHKKLGKVKITEVFEIEMWVGNDAPLVTGYNLKDTYELARRDGFKGGKDGKYMDFYNYFDSKKYGWLNTPKRFSVYRWEWL